jgi:hypothetical protein
MKKRGTKQSNAILAIAHSPISRKDLLTTLSRIKFTAAVIATRASLAIASLTSTERHTASHFGAKSVWCEYRTTKRSTMRKCTVHAAFAKSRMTKSRILSCVSLCERKHKSEKPMPLLAELEACPKDYMAITSNFFTKKIDPHSEILSSLTGTRSIRDDETDIDDEKLQLPHMEMRPYGINSAIFRQNGRVQTSLSRFSPVEQQNSTRPPMYYKYITSFKHGLTPYIMNTNEVSHACHIATSSYAHNIWERYFYNMEGNLIVASSALNMRQMKELETFGKNEARNRMNDDDFVHLIREVFIVRGNDVEVNEPTFFIMTFQFVHKSHCEYRAFVLPNADFNENAFYFQVTIFQLEEIFKLKIVNEWSVSLLTESHHKEHQKSQWRETSISLDDLKYLASLSIQKLKEAMKLAEGKTSLMPSSSK